MDPVIRLSHNWVLCQRLCIIAFFLASMLWISTQAQLDDSPAVLTQASGFHRAISEEEMAGIYKDNQNADWAPWAGTKYGVRHLYRLVDTLLKGRPQKYLSLVVIKAGRITFLPLAARPMGLTMNRMKAIVEGLRNGSRAGLVYPDTVYLMNVWDEGRCYRDDDPRVTRNKAPPPRCSVPVFSLIKSWDYEAKTSNETDVLLPFFNHVYENLVFYPWEKKASKALMRAAMQAQMRPNCTRLWIIELSRTHPDGRRLIDAGITNNLSKRKDIQLVDFVPIPDHARYKYLLSADGFTASCRLGKLLGTNSVVLKETTPWIEYYYRSLKPGVHFVPFNKDNVLQVLQSLEADPGRCQRIAAEAQQFAYTFLSQHGKAMYVKRALVYYNSLLTDMEEFMEGLVWPAAASGSGGDGGAGSAGSLEGGGGAGGGGGDEGGGLTLVGLMEQMKKFVRARRRRRRE